MKSMRTAGLIGLIAVGALISGAPGDPAEDAPAQKKPPLAKGHIQKIELGKKLLVIETKNGPETFILTDAAYIFRAKEKLSANKLKPGDLIALSYYVDTDDRRVVRRIKVVAPEPLPPSPPP
jgi:hypothetical protein